AGDRYASRDRGAAGSERGNVTLAIRRSRNRRETCQQGVARRHGLAHVALITAGSLGSRDGGGDWSRTVRPSWTAACPSAVSAPNRTTEPWGEGAGAHPCTVKREGSRTIAPKRQAIARTGAAAPRASWRSACEIPSARVAVP